jgi:hypothetical protein
MQWLPTVLDASGEAVIAVAWSWLMDLQVSRSCFEWDFSETVRAKIVPRIIFGPEVLRRPPLNLETDLDPQE